MAVVSLKSSKFKHFTELNKFKLVLAIKLHINHQNLTFAVFHYLFYQIYQKNYKFKDF